MMENVKWLIQKRGISIIVLLVTVIACSIVLRGPKHEKTEDMEESSRQQAEGSRQKFLLIIWKEWMMMKSTRKK